MGFNSGFKGLNTDDTTGNVPRVVTQPARHCALKLKLDQLWYTLTFLFLFSKIPDRLWIRTHSIQWVAEKKGWSMKLITHFI